MDGAMVMCDARSLVVAAVVVMVASAPVVAQTESSYRVLVPRSGEMQKALDNLTASGERVLLADAGVGVVIAQRGTTRAYLFVDDLERFITSKKIPAGFAFMP